MFKIDEATKNFIKANYDKLSVASILNLLRNEIKELIDKGIKKKQVYEILKSELEIELNLQSFYSYLKRNKNFFSQGKSVKEKKVTRKNKFEIENDFLGII